MSCITKSQKWRRRWWWRGSRHYHFYTIAAFFSLSSPFLPLLDVVLHIIMPTPSLNLCYTLKLNAPAAFRTTNASPGAIIPASPTALNKAYVTSISAIVLYFVNLLGFCLFCWFSGGNAGRLGRRLLRRRRPRQVRFTDGIHRHNAVVEYHRIQRVHCRCRRVRTRHGSDQMGNWLFHQSSHQP